MKRLEEMKNKRAYTLEDVWWLVDRLDIAINALEWIAGDNLHGGHLATDAHPTMYGRAAQKALRRIEED
jgi:hypothetical protein